MRILVTGAAGFVGHHVAAMLCKAGHTVFGLDDYRAGVDFMPPDVEPYGIALENYIAGETHEGVQAVVHCAARADVSLNWESRNERDELLISNVDGTINLLEAHPGVPFVMLSTCAIYGDTPVAPATEADVTPVTSPYAASKLAGEAYVQAYAHKHGNPWHIFRLGCVVGSGYHHGHIADFVRMAREEKHIHAKNNGHSLKSFVHVADVVAAVEYALFGRSLRVGVYNLAGGSWSWRMTVQRMRAMRDDFKVTAEDRKHGWVGDPMAIADSSLFQRRTSHEWRNIEEGVDDALISLGWGK